MCVHKSRTDTHPAKRVWPATGVGRVRWCPKDILTFTFADGIGAINSFATSQVVQSFASVARFFPCPRACRANTCAVTIACSVTAGKIVDEDFASIAYETVVLVRPGIGLATTVRCEIGSCGKQGMHLWQPQKTNRPNEKRKSRHTCLNG